MGYHGMKAYDVANEQAVLAAIFVDEHFARRVMASVRALDFIGRKHRVVFRAAIECIREEVPLTAENVAARTGGKEFGGLAKLRELAKFGPVDGLDGRIAKLRTDAARCNVERLVKGVVEVSADGDKSFSDVLVEADRLVSSLRSAVPSGGNGGSAAQWVDNYQQRRDGVEGRFRSTGYAPLDEVLTEGYSPGSLTVLAGRPRVGKTMYVVDTVRRFLRDRHQNGKILVVMLEKDRNYFLDLLVSCDTRIDKRLLIREPSSLDLEQHESVMKSSARLFRDGRLSVLDNPIREILGSGGRWTNETVVSRMVETMAREGASLVFWDIWQRGMVDVRPEALSVALARFYDAGRVLGVHNVVVQQLRRSAEDRTREKDRRPRLVDLKQTGAYEEYADQVLLIHREKLFRPFLQRDVMEVVVAKQKLGEDGVTMLADFEPETCRLNNPRVADVEDVEFIGE